MRNALIIGLLATAMTAASGVAAVAGAGREPAVDVCVSVTSFNVTPFYVRGPRIIHVPRPGHEVERRDGDSAGSTASIIRRHGARLTDRHDLERHDLERQHLYRHALPLPLPRRRPPTPTPKPATEQNGAVKTAPPLPHLGGQIDQPEKFQSSEPTDATASVPPGFAPPPPPKKTLAPGAKLGAEAIKPDVKSDAKPEVKPDAKSDAKPDAKSDAKPDAKSDAKPEVKPDAKSDAKPASNTPVEPPTNI